MDSAASSAATPPSPTPSPEATPKKNGREAWSLMAEQEGFPRPQHVGDCWLGETDCQLQLNMLPSTPEFSFVAFLNASSQLALLPAETEWVVKSSRRKASGGEAPPVFRVVGSFRLNRTAGTGTGVLQLYGPVTLRRR